MSENILVLEQIKKSFQNTAVLHGIDLHVKPGEFITLLGASGCGKTTTLRIIAGLEYPDHGKVILNGRDVTYTEPHLRDVNTVFQSYALFPHMTVAQNIAYGLRLKKVRKAVIRDEVNKALQLVQLEGLKERMPAELSGGQRQRVAIARAIINKPHLLLLDEPLGALDLHLRRQMQIELKRLQQQLGITFIYITHDQEEALNMSDRIAVMRNGLFEQIGTPAEIYNQPQTSYVAQFVGNANLIHGTVAADTKNNPAVSKETILVDACEGHIPVPSKGRRFAPGTSVTLAIRSENVLISEFSEKNNGLPATVIEKSFIGGMLRITLRLCNDEELTASRHGLDIDFAVGDFVSVSWAKTNAILVDLEVAADEA